MSFVIVLAIIANITMIMMVLHRKESSSISVLLLASGLFTCLYVPFLPYRQIGNYQRHQTLLFIENISDMIENNKPVYDITSHSLELLYKYSFVLICKNRFMKCWKPEQCSQLRASKHALYEMTLLFSLLLIYAGTAYPVVRYYPLTSYCDACRGYKRPHVRPVFHPTSSKDRWDLVWLYNLLHGSCFPVVINVLLPSVILIAMNLALSDDSKTPDEETSLYDSSVTSNNVWWMSYWYLLMELPAPLVYMKFYDAERISFDTNEQLFAVVSMFEAINAGGRAIIFIALEMKNGIKILACLKRRAHQQ